MESVSNLKLRPKFSVKAPAPLTDFEFYQPFERSI
jgi:hypothetical protein